MSATLYTAQLRKHVAALESMYEHARRKFGALFAELEPPEWRVAIESYKALVENEHNNDAMYEVLHCVRLLTVSVSDCGRLTMRDPSETITVVELLSALRGHR